MQLTKRMKFLASCVNPTFGKFSTWDEVRKAKLAARGRYWIDRDYDEYVTFTPSGKRKFFDYDNDSEKGVRKCAVLWAKGKRKAACDLYKSFHGGCCFRNKSQPIHGQRVNYLDYNIWHIKATRVVCCQPGADILG